MRITWGHEDMKLDDSPVTRWILIGLFAVLGFLLWGVAGIRSMVTLRYSGNPYFPGAVSRHTGRPVGNVDLAGAAAFWHGLLFLALAIGIPIAAYAAILVAARMSDGRDDT